MRETARPEVKRRRRFKTAVAPATPEPLVADKYYAGEITCRMVKLGIEVPGCKGKFKPRGNQVACSPGCIEALNRYHNKKSEKKNRPKHRPAINARERAKEEEKRKALQFTCQGPIDPKTTGGERCGKPVPYKKHSEMLYCSDRCFMNCRNEVKRQRRLEQPQPKKVKDKYCKAPHPTIPGKKCGKEFRVVGKVSGLQKYCSPKCRRRARLIADNAARIQKNRAKGVRPKAEVEAASLSRTKPWLAKGISRTTWYRRKRGKR
jgi:hypothetical protein